MMQVRSRFYRRQQRGVEVNLILQGTRRKVVLASEEDKRAAKERILEDCAHFREFLLAVAGVCLIT